MRLLLDTHTLLWFLTGDAKLSAEARILIEDPSHQKLVSIASLWEIAIKSSLGKLRLERPFGEIFPSQINENGFVIHPVNMEHVTIVAALPFLHRDPFDRLIVAQCLVEGLSLVGFDTQLDAYGIKRLW